MVLTTPQCQKIRSTLPALNCHGEEIATTFYQGLLRGHPELKNYFNAANLENKLQPRAMASLIIKFASNVNNIHELIPSMERICHKHASVGVQSYHYAAMERHLLDALTGVLDSSMTLDAKIAWKNAYWTLANMFITRERQLYDSFGSWTNWRAFIVDKKIYESQDIASFYLRPENGAELPAYGPGQYVSIKVATEEEKCPQIRQYALSDAPNAHHYRITVQRDQGLDHETIGGDPCPHRTSKGIVSNHMLDHVKIGDYLALNHPAGHVFLDTSNPSNAPVVLISKGIGATPMLSILEYIAKFQPNRKVAWISTSSHIFPFRQRVEDLCAHCDSRRCVFVKRGPQASSTEQANGEHKFGWSLIQEDYFYFDYDCTEYFVCGSEYPMVQLVDFLEAHGVDKSRIKYELQSVARS
ncbi:flavohemoprotein [Moelleriella libera RCEF 2490]|uniref:nitric oxide dioxygenase n=1 Tax=Moelleriella libera RCEF 2490 TaxID=1081109 RepID=A0A168EFL9_9HYPO|nr:flavohemoprotein [Moelleriella libera RCEF 2490]